MALFLRQVRGHPRVTDAFRVIHKAAGEEIEIGSIGLQTGSHQRRYWSWGIDTVLPRQPFATQGEARDRDDAMAQFKACPGLDRNVVEHLANPDDQRRRDLDHRGCSVVEREQEAPPTEGGFLFSNSAKLNLYSEKRPQCGGDWGQLEVVTMCTCDTQLRNPDRRKLFPRDSGLF
jgi:hypothetical protein